MNAWLATAATTRDISLQRVIRFESVEYALEFARSLTGEFAGEVQLVEV